jgi:hypothetical protein
LGRAIAKSGCVLITGACPGLLLAAACGAKHEGAMVVRIFAKNGLRKSMTELDERLNRYTSIGDRLMKIVILPRVAKLADCYAGVQPPEVQRSRHSCVYRFPHTPASR